MLEIFASTPENMGLGEVGDFARRVEAMGYDGLFVSDAVHDGLLLAGQALASTSTIKVGTSVLIAFLWTPGTNSGMRTRHGSLPAPMLTSLGG